MRTQYQTRTARPCESIRRWYFIYSIQTSTVPVPGDKEEYQHDK